jgi:hypothetical protein
VRVGPAILTISLVTVAFACGSPAGEVFSTVFPPIDGDPIGSLDVNAA